MRSRRFLRLFENNLGLLPPGRWYLLADGHVSTSGVHGRGDQHDIPAPSVEHEDWTWYANWCAFPGKKGDGSDCPPKTRELLEQIYRGHRCAHVFLNSGASSFHLDIGEFALVIDLSRAADEIFQDAEFGLPPFTFFSGSRRRRGLDPKSFNSVDEFMYPGWETLIQIAQSREANLEKTEMPGPQHYQKPKPGETVDSYWNRQVTAADAPNWVNRYYDGD